MNIYSIIIIAFLACTLTLIMIFLLEEYHNNKREKKRQPEQRPAISYYTPDGLLNEIELRIMLDNL